MDIPALGITHADYFYGGIPCTRELSKSEVEEAYELNTGKVIVECIKDRRIDPMAVPGIAVKNHGPFSWGKRCRCFSLPCGCDGRGCGDESENSNVES
ncbi:class II aldolase/adducin family protein [Lachnospiraceae bacterium 48-21]